MSLVCLSTKKSGHIEKFESENLIPQILFSILFHDVDEAKRGFKGIAYSSTQADGINYAIPALMPKDKILFVMKPTKPPPARAVVLKNVVKSSKFSA